MNAKRLFLFALAAGAVVAVVRHNRPEPSPATAAAGTIAAEGAGAGEEAVLGEPVQTPALTPPAFFRSGIRPWVRTRHFEIAGPDGPALQIKATDEGAALWLHNAGRSGAVQAGVHANGFPFFLVSDGAVRNFGLARVDGANASPILVYRHNDDVKLVFGLSMSRPGQPPFLATYDGSGQRTDVIGAY